MLGVVGIHVGGDSGRDQGKVEAESTGLESGWL